MNAFANVIPPPKVFASDAANNNLITGDVAFLQLNTIKYVVICLPHIINKIIAEIASGNVMIIGETAVNFIDCVTELLIVDQVFMPLTTFHTSLAEEGYR